MTGARGKNKTNETAGLAWLRVGGRLFTSSLRLSLSSLQASLYINKAYEPLTSRTALLLHLPVSVLLSGNAVFIVPLSFDFDLALRNSEFLV